MTVRAAAGHGERRRRGWRRYGFRRAVAVTAAAVLVLLTGCKIRFEADARVAADGSGTYCVTMSFDEEFLAGIETFAELSDGEFTHPLDEMEDQAPAGWDAERVQLADTEGVRICRDFDDLADFEQAVRETQDLSAEAAEGPADPGSLAGDFSIEREGTEFTFTADPRAAFAAGEDPLTDAPEELEFEVAYRIRLPGEVREHNAHRVENGVLLWEFTVDDPPTEMLRAVSDASGDSGSDFPVVTVLVVALVVGAVIGGAALTRRLTGAPPPAGGPPDMSDPGAAPPGSPGAGEVPPPDTAATPPPSGLEPPLPGPPEEPPPAGRPPPPPPPPD